MFESDSIYIDINANIWDLERCSNGDADIESKLMDTKGAVEVG
jgi:hypothetical protein